MASCSCYAIRDGKPIRIGDIHALHIHPRRMTTKREIDFEIEPSIHYRILMEARFNQERLTVTCPGMFNGEVEIEIVSDNKVRVMSGGRILRIVDAYARWKEEEENSERS